MYEDHRNFNRDRFQVVQMNLSLKPLDPLLFSDKAEEAARLCTRSKTMNASSQVRRFYDELVMWHDKILSRPVAEQQATFSELRPFIQMIRAKIAYARGRKLVDDQFVAIFDDLIKKIVSLETLVNAKLFMEAFLGFKKYLESDK